MSMTLDSVSKNYRDFQLRDISFEVPIGRIVGFLGPNGSGKSTTLRILLGLEDASGGQALIDGVPYSRLRHPLCTVGSVLDTQWINGHQRGVHYLRWLATSNSIASSRIPEVLELVDLSHAATRKVSKYSLGMRQRLGIAAALLGEPTYLVFDEPLNGLDPEGIRWVRELLPRLRDAGHGILLSSHILSEVAAIADDVVMIINGHISDKGPMDRYRGERALEEAYFAHLASQE